jgi:hypothetical protein
METTYLGKSREQYEQEFATNCLVALMKSTHALSPVYKRIVLDNANDLYIQGIISLQFLRELRNEI